MLSPLGLVCRIHQLHLCSRVRPHPPSNKCSEYDTIPSNGEDVVLEFWVMCSTL